MNDEPLEIEPADADRVRSSGADVEFIDVRQQWENEICRIEPSRLIPMQTLPARLQDLDRDREIIVYCHHGVRSMMAARFLRDAGFRARSLSGGVARWADEIDPAMRRY